MALFSRILSLQSSFRPLKFFHLGDTNLPLEKEKIKVRGSTAEPVTHAIYSNQINSLKQNVGVLTKVSPSLNQTLNLLLLLFWHKSNVESVTRHENSFSQTLFIQSEWAGPVGKNPKGLAPAFAATGGSTQHWLKNPEHRCMPHISDFVGNIKIPSTATTGRSDYG